MVAFLSLPVLILTASIVSAFVVPQSGDPLARRSSTELEARSQHYDPLDCSNTHGLGCTPSIDTPSSTPPQPVPTHVSSRSDSACDEIEQEDDGEHSNGDDDEHSGDDEDGKDNKDNKADGDDGDNGDDGGDGGDGDEVPPPANNKGGVRLASSGSGYKSGGFATWYYQGGSAGACGDYHKDTELVAAMDRDLYGNLNAKSSLCGKHVQIINTKNNKQVTVLVADACPTCRNSNSIDLSRGAFKKIADYDEGEVPIKWKYV